MSSANITFGFSDEQKIMRDSVLSLLARELPVDRINELDKAGEFPLDAYAALADAGWMGLPFPEKYGGIGGSYKDLTVLTEALGYHDTGLAAGYLVTVIYAGMHVYLHGSEAMREEFLPQIISGSKKLALCLTEPDTGSDAAGIKTFARRDGDDYVINGQKIYNTGAHVADAVVLAARTDPDATGYTGMSLLLVDTDLPGVTIRPIDALGRHTIKANHCFFEDVRIPVSRVIGAENKGWHDLMECLNVERLCLAAAGTGNIQRIIEHTRDYAKQRIQFGQPISKFQAIAHKFADMETGWHTARQMSFHVANMLDAGENPVIETAIAKLHATDACWKAADLGMQIMAGAGFILDYSMQRLFRDARVGTIGGGTNEIQRNVIAKQMGL